MTLDAHTRPQTKLRDSTALQNPVVNLRDRWDPWSSHFPRRNVFLPPMLNVLPPKIPRSRFYPATSETLAPSTAPCVSPVEHPPTRQDGGTSAPLDSATQTPLFPSRSANSPPVAPRGSSPAIHSLRPALQSPPA